MSNFSDQENQMFNQRNLTTQMLWNRVIAEINRKISSGINYKKMLDFIFDSLDTIIPYDRIGIAILEGSGEESILHLVWVKSKMEVRHLNVNYSAQVKGSTLQNILNSGQPRIINDLVKYSSDHPQSLSTQLAIQDGVRSSLTCPLRADNKQVGVVFFSSAKSNTYEHGHVETFLEIADELSVIVEYGRLKNDFEANSSQRHHLNMILHDLKSPLSTIQGFAELALQEPWFQKLDQDGKEVFQVFIRSSRYMFDLLNALLEIGRLDQKLDVISVSEVKLQEFGKEMENFGKILAEPKEISIYSNIAEEIPIFATFDRFKVQRVLDNLFSNAVKYSKRGARVDFTMSVKESHLIFSVRDYGLGIPESELSKLFHEFGKTSVRPTEGETSTGLGLAIAKKLVDQQQGEITVSSKVGEGSNFTFWIPLSGSANIH